MAYQFNPLTGNFDIVNPQLTGSEIKTLYEGEDNTNVFTDAEKSKLTALNSDNYATAEQGAKADNSVQLTGNQTVKGIKTFTEKLLLPNCLLINGVAHFNQSTTPTQRVFLVNDAVVTESLVIGDRWSKTGTGDDAFWTGTNWVSTWINYTGGRRSSGSSAPNFTEATEWGYPQGSRVLIRNASASLSLASAGDTNNFVFFRILGVTVVNGAVTLYSSSTKMFASGRNTITNEAVNQVVDASYFGNTIVGLYTVFVSQGSPPAFTNIAASIGWSLIYE